MEVLNQNTEVIDNC